MRDDALRQAVQPYLQLVEQGVNDTETGIALQDIWRYFRYTWLIPQTPIPGRSLFYLVRDAAHERHAVIGIAALSNCPAQMVPRDNAIGWSASGLTSALADFLDPPDDPVSNSQPLALQGIYQWLLRQSFADAGKTFTTDNQRDVLKQVMSWLRASVANAIGEIETKGLVKKGDLKTPEPETIDRLRRLSKEFASQRQDALGENGKSNVATESSLSEAPVDDEVLDLEAKNISSESRKMLVRKKRAFELARLLDAKRILAMYGDQLTDPKSVLETLNVEEVRAAISTAMSSIKSHHMGTNMLEITTCGAIAPYNCILGGKLIALLLLSPQIASDYHKRYGKQPAIIRSQLKNRKEVPDSTLVWLGTTSLFSHSASQYERLRLPAGVIAPDQSEIRYRYLGHSTGYGTVQFADDTVRALENVMQRQRGYRDVNSVFGEGASPRLRKLRTGLDAIGFNASHMMFHHQERRVYGMPLFPEAATYLCGLEQKPPDYVRKPEAYPDASEHIAGFWRQRWLSSRLKHEASWDKLGKTKAWLLSNLIQDQNLVAYQPDSQPLVVGSTPTPPGDASDDGNDSGIKAELDFWRRLSRADANAVTEGLDDSDFERLHLPTPLEDILIEQLRKGHSLVLTGNAGDGKTHLARALKRRLGAEADRIVFELDATASMAGGSVDPLIKVWRKTLKEKKSFVLAINQYPLHMLRRELRKKLPEIAKSLDQQWSARLCVDPSVRPDAKSLLLIDLSLRNPLSQSFAERVLNQLLENNSIQRYAKSDDDQDFTSNFNRLKDPLVQKRLFYLFKRVISSGRRATIRELWILCARLLFGAPDDAHTHPGSLQSSYFERLFKQDARFPLTDFLARVADPAQVSHPQIDLYLEDQRPSDLPSPSSKHYQNRFMALKRRFYFEEDQKDKQVFELDDSSHGEFHAMLEAMLEKTGYSGHLLKLIEAINLCYFPLEKIEDKLCLWIGHRLDEQPTKSFVASECISFKHLALWLPMPPDPLAKALEHQPDHLLLGLRCKSDTELRHFSLRIDATLFNTLKSIRSGLPRHLINPGELNRLDGFVDRLRGAPEPETLPDFLIYNAKHVTSNAVQLSADFDRYERIRRLSSI